MKKRLILTAVAVLLVVILMGGGKIYRHEKNQQERIDALEAEYSMIHEKLYAETVSWEEEAFNYLAIGNSITLHEYADYWWNEVGMAASDREKDYVHLVEKYLVDRYGKVVTYPYNFYVWEIQGADRAEAVTLLDHYLSDNLDLVTIQLGENAKDLSTWESDFEYLLTYIKSAAPAARVVVIGDFWDYKDRDGQKEKAAERCGAVYISLEEIKDNAEYQAGMGAIVYGDDGLEHIIGHEGVAKHPGDKGMAYIAGAVERAVEDRPSDIK